MSIQIKQKKKIYFEINFLKFIFVFGMFIRHGTFYFYESRYVEYGIDGLSLFNFFLPVTAAFIFILGYTLGISYKVTKLPCKAKYLIIGIKLFVFALFVALVTYFLRVYNHLPIGFMEYFFLTPWDKWPKPGLYILFPIAILYILYYMWLFDTKKIFLILLFPLMMVLSFYNLYVVHYLWFGIGGFVLGSVLTHDSVREKLFRVKFFSIGLVLYTSIFLSQYTEVITIVIEGFMLILFMVIFGYLSKFDYHDRIKIIINFTANNIFLFYVVHMIGFNILARVLKIELSYVGIFIFSSLYFVLVYGIVNVMRKRGWKLI